MTAQTLKSPARLAFAILLSAGQALSGSQLGATPMQVTEYYTMVNRSVQRKDCSGEGNQIVGGQLYGSDCKPVKKYCAYGIGARNVCIRPCLDAAGAKGSFGKFVKIPPKICKWGPFKGHVIRQVRIVDVGGAVQGNHVDVFMGLCRKAVRGVCREFEPDDYMIAEYGGHHFVRMRSTHFGSHEDASR